MSKLWGCGLQSLRRLSSDFDSREAATEGTVAQGEPTSVSEIGVTLGTLVRPNQGSRPSRFFGGYAGKKREGREPAVICSILTWGFIDLAIAKIVRPRLLFLRSPLRG